LLKFLIVKLSASDQGPRKAGAKLQLFYESSKSFANYLIFRPLILIFVTHMSSCTATGIPASATSISLAPWAAWIPRLPTSTTTSCSTHLQ
jgi:hypothetical protein